ncbi:MAG: hypothetical protein U1E73_06960 [Planctomycetota bacterium]
MPATRRGANRNAASMRDDADEALFGRCRGAGDIAALGALFDRSASALLRDAVLVGQR